MKNILYRGKAINRYPDRQYRTSYKNGDWVFGLVTKLDEYGAEMTNEIGVSGIDVDAESIGQFTGLTDKNGKRIFEGDIVAGMAYSSQWIGVIVWIDKIASFGVRYRYKDKPTAWEKSSILNLLNTRFPDEFTAEVIGNIYDNPKLLKKYKE